MLSLGNTFLRIVLKHLFSLWKTCTLKSLKNDSKNIPWLPDMGDTVLLWKGLLCPENTMFFSETRRHKHHSNCVPPPIGDGLWSRILPASVAKGDFPGSSVETEEAIPKTLFSVNYSQGWCVQVCVCPETECTISTLISSSPHESVSNVLSWLSESWDLGLLG